MGGCRGQGKKEEASRKLRPNWLGLRTPDDADWRCEGVGVGGDDGEGSVLLARFCLACLLRDYNDWALIGSRWERVTWHVTALTLADDTTRLDGVWRVKIDEKGFLNLSYK